MLEQNNGAAENESSILDKIISSKEDRARQEFNPSDVLATLLKKLNTKEADVLQARFGLNGKNRETLEAIGKRYNVTRERIRQIENLAIHKLKHDPEFPNLIKPIEHVISSVLTEHGGIMSGEHLLEQLFLATQKNEANVRAILFILHKLLDSQFLRHAPTKQHNLKWRTKVSSLEFLEETVEEVRKIIAAENRPLKLEELMKKFEATEFFKANGQRLNEKVVVAYLEVVTHINRNPFSEYGLIEWGAIRPKRMNDKIKLVLQKEHKPMHFVAIADKISEIFGKKAYPPTVHNELILNKEYVLVGRGIYALKEWGYREGVVAEVIAEIIKEAGHPLDREEITKKVVSQRLVKRNTIHLALTNKKIFVKLPDGRYNLVEEK